MAKFFSRNALTDLFAKRMIEAPVTSIRIGYILGQAFTDVELTSTNSRGRLELAMRKSLRGQYLRSCSSSSTASHFTTGGRANVDLRRDNTKSQSKAASR